jgi:hypothetical protein
MHVEGLRHVQSIVHGCSGRKSLLHCCPAVHTYHVQEVLRPLAVAAGAEVGGGGAATVLAEVVQVRSSPRCAVVAGVELGLGGDQMKWGMHPVGAQVGAMSCWCNSGRVRGNREAGSSSFTCRWSSFATVASMQVHTGHSAHCL